jgi:hypothetical protein
LPKNRDKLKLHVKGLRLIRKVHRWTGLVLMLFLLIVGGTGILLGWKKYDKFGIMPPTNKSASINPEEWIDFNQIFSIAYEEFHSTSIKIDVRGSKGIAKVINEDSFEEIQIDLSNGAILSKGMRYSDWIEKIHDGSILEKITFGQGEYFKRFYTLFVGLSLITFCLTGFWLWFGPKYIKKLR